MKKNKNSIIILTGISGAGKTQAIRFFEDTGYFCIDNLPLVLFDKIIELSGNLSGKYSRIALCMDTRSGNDFSRLFYFINILKNKNIFVKIIYFDARDEILLRRYSETRRRPPLSDKDEGILTGLKKERHLLKQVMEKADFYLDTSDYNVKDLRGALRKIIKEKYLPKEVMSIGIVAFGYKFGLPENADIVLDVRFMPNPFYISKLRVRNGLDSRVKDYVFRSAISIKFIKKLKALLLFLIPQYLAEGKTYLTIGFGCTGGQHRSVVIANEIYKFLKNKKYQVNLVLRDLNKIYSE